jgi:magnesium chelatase family protein
MMRRRYRDRISGPIRDRIDIHRTMTAPSRPELMAAVDRSKTTAELAPVVAEARERQRARLRGSPWMVNSDIPGAELRKRWPVVESARMSLEAQLRSQKLSARSADRVLGLSWSVADLRRHDTPNADDVALALALRRGTPLGSGLRGLVADL